MNITKKSIPPAVVFACAVLAGTFGFCGSSTDDAWAVRRAEALARPRTFVYNTDGNDAHNWPSNLPVTVGNFTGRRRARHADHHRLVLPAQLWVRAPHLPQGGRTLLRAFAQGFETCDGRPFRDGDRPS